MNETFDLARVHELLGDGFRSMDWAELVDPVLLQGARQQMRNHAVSNATRRLKEAHRDEWHELYHEELAEQERIFCRRLEAMVRRANGGRA